MNSIDLHQPVSELLISTVLHALGCTYWYGVKRKDRVVSFLWVILTYKKKLIGFLQISAVKL